jgi:hypothetical protein
MNKMLLLILSLPVLPAAASEKPAHGAHVLLDHLVPIPMAYVPSQVFDADHAQYNSLGADDFTVPAGTFWVVKSIIVEGTYFYGTGPAVSQNLYIYHDRNGMPGKPVHNGSLTNVGGQGNDGDFEVQFPGRGLKLHAGTYWVSVQANMAYNVGVWGWESGDFLYSGNPAVWKNPGNGWAKKCRGWKVETACWPEGQGPAKAFIIFGAAGNE